MAVIIRKPWYSTTDEAGKVTTLNEFRVPTSPTPGEDVIGIEYGGTGANTAHDALQNISESVLEVIRNPLNQAKSLAIGPEENINISTGTYFSVIAGEEVSLTGTSIQLYGTIITDSLIIFPNSETIGSHPTGARVFEINQPNSEDDAYTGALSLNNQHVVLKYTGDSGFDAELQINQQNGGFVVRNYAYDPVRTLLSIKAYEGMLGINTDSPTFLIDGQTRDTGSEYLLRLGNQNSQLEVYGYDPYVNIVSSTGELSLSNNLIRLTDLGKVGINNPTPSDKLHVNAADTNGITITTPNSTQFKLFTDGTVIANRNWKIATNYANNGDFAVVYSSDATSEPVVANTAIYVTSAGRVGIGTTSPSATVKLQVTGGSVLTSAGNYLTATSNYGFYDGTASSGMQVDGATGATFVRFKTNSSNRMSIIHDGKVGINTTTPSELLHVSGGNIQLDNNYAIKSKSAAGTAFNLLNYTSADNVVIRGGAVGTDTTIFGGDGSTSTTYLVIKSNGDVGIGKQPSSGKLDVNGTIKSTGLTVSSNLINVTTAKTPASATATGTTGDICWDSNYVYVCVATNTWKRAALLTW